MTTYSTTEGGGRVSVWIGWVFRVKTAAPVGEGAGADGWKAMQSMVTGFNDVVVVEVGVLGILLGEDSVRLA